MVCLGRPRRLGGWEAGPGDFLGWRPVAVVRVIGELGLEGAQALAQGDVFGFEEGEVGCELIDAGWRVPSELARRFPRRRGKWLGLPAVSCRAKLLAEAGCERMQIHILDLDIDCAVAVVAGAPAGFAQSLPVGRAVACSLEA